jgi:hypothetical protein
MDERTASTWICAQLPALRSRARLGGWEWRLDRIVGDVRNSGSASLACSRLGYPIDDSPTRGQLDRISSLAGFNIESVPVSGDYTCPKQACDRRARCDSNGREPVCWLFDQTMNFHPGH